MANMQMDSRPRAHSTLSSESKRSHKSRISNGSNKLELTESPKDKLRIHGKTDPSAAINEMQPAAMALEKPTLENLRQVSFTDRSGQLINEPDASNPTRSRWESPLQTIRSFEEDVSRTYREKRLASGDYRPQSRGDMFSQGQSRRSSYFGASNQNNQSQSRLSGYYRGYDNGDENQPGFNASNAPGPNAYAQNTYNQGANAYAPRMNRGLTEPMMNGEQQYNYYNSREASTASPETDQFGNSTGPSSYNSSLDQVGGMVSPPKNATVPAPAPRVPMKLDTGVDKTGGFEDFQQTNTKKQSWLKKRFSKN